MRSSSADAQSLNGIFVIDWYDFFVSSFNLNMFLSALKLRQSSEIANTDDGVGLVAKIRAVILIWVS